MSLPDVISELPGELKQRILAPLTRKELSRMALASRGWRIEATEPSLWKEFPLVVRREEELEPGGRLEMLLRMERLSKIQSVKIDRYITIPESSIQCMDAHQNLRILHLTNTTLHDIPPSLLTTLLTRMEVVHLLNARVNPSLLEHLFTAMNQGDPV